MKLLIELPTWLGDCVMATPAIENVVKQYNNQCEIIFIGSKSSVELMSMHPKCVNSYVLSKRIVKDISTIRSIKSIDIFISFRSSKRTKLFYFFLDSKCKYQFNKKKFSSGHQVEKYNSFVQEALGINSPPGKLRIFRKEFNFSSELPLLGVNPGASYGSAKCWPYEKFVEVILTLSKKFDIVIFGGNKEVTLAKKIVRKLEESNCKISLNLAGKTTIEELVDYISSLDLFITGDSGPMHIASAFQIPTISIFGPTKVLETCQWKNDKSIIIKKELPCQPCMKRVCPLGHHDCMKKISSEEVVNSALSLI